MIELSPPLAAQDFEDTLDATSVEHDICWVDDDVDDPYAHGLGLRNWPCDDNDGTVWERTMDWLDDNT